MDEPCGDCGSITNDRAYSRALFAWLCTGRDGAHCNRHLNA